MAWLFAGLLSHCWRGLAYINTTYFWHCLEGLAKQCVHDKWSILEHRKTPGLNLEKQKIDIFGHEIFECRFRWQVSIWKLLHTCVVRTLDRWILRCLCVCKSGSSSSKEAWPCTGLHPKGLHLRDGYCFQCILFNTQYTKQYTYCIYTQYIHSIHSILPTYTVYSIWGTAIAFIALSSIHSILNNTHIAYILSIHTVFYCFQCIFF